MNDDLVTIAEPLRRRLQELLAAGAPVGDDAQLLADIEAEQIRHRRAVQVLTRRAEGMASQESQGPARFLDRPHPAGVDPRASLPDQRNLAITKEETARGVVFAFGTANPTFYRAVIDRLGPNERVRNVTTNHGTFEYSREEFLAAIPDIAASPSYQTGTASAPGACRYVTGSPSVGMKRLQRAD